MSELLLLVKKGDQKVAKLEAELRSYRDDIHAKKAEFDGREKELLDYVHQLLSVHDQYRSFVDVLLERCDVQQFDLDRILQLCDRSPTAPRKADAESGVKKTADSASAGESHCSLLYYISYQTFLCLFPQFYGVSHSMNFQLTRFSNADLVFICVALGMQLIEPACC